MKKSKKLLTLLLATMLVLALMMGVIACNPPEDDTNDNDVTTEETVDSETLLVTNGNFATTTGSTYVKSASNWTLTAGAWSKSSTGLNTGVVDVSEDAFEANKGAVNSNVGDPGVAPSTPKKDDKYVDTNALVISMDEDEKNGSIFYASSTVTVKKGTYYKLSMDVWTDILVDDANANNSNRGANVIVSQGTSASSVIVAKFSAINTNKAWQTYNVYIEGSNFEDRSFNVQLWLGYGPSKMKDKVNNGDTSLDSIYTAKGTAMFDNVTMTEIKKEVYDSAVVSQYNTLSNASETARTQEMQKVYGIEAGNDVVLSYEYLNNNFTGAAGYSTSSQQNSYYTAKVGSTANYTVVKGKENLSSSDNFPSYSSTNDATGVFDLTKLYYVDSKESNNFANAYGKVSTTFVAPDHAQLGVSYTPEAGYKFSSPANPLDSRALLVYHQNNKISGAGFQSSFDILIENNKYYAISVWAFIWVPELDEKTYCGDLATIEGKKPELGAEDYDKKLAEYNKEMEAYNLKKAEYDVYNAYYTGTEEVFATMRLTGASTDAKLEDKTSGAWGTWQQLTIKVKGNELADRKVGLELWYGEGEWGDDTLYPGGCFFDSVTIMEYATEGELDAEYDDATYGNHQAWDEIKVDDYDAFGLNGASELFTALGSEEKDGWYYNVIDDNTFVNMDSDESNLYAGIVSGAQIKANADQSTVKALNGLNLSAEDDVLELGNTTVFDLVVLNHAEYTASKIYFKPTGDLLKTNPNSFYRFSMWVNTKNLKSGSTFTVSLYDKENDTVINSSATQTSLAISEWTELSFVIQASATESDEMYLLVEFGKGDIYTPANHTKGAVLITAMTWKSIDYSEYDESKGSYVKKVDLSSSTSTGSSITNSDFSAIDTSTYKLDKEEYDKVFTDGKITGIATPKSWTKTSEAYLISAPTVNKNDSDHLITWKENVEETTHFFIYNKDKKLIKVIDETTAVKDTDYTEKTEGEDPNTTIVRTYQYKVATNNTYYVRALVLDTINEKVLYASPLASGKTTGAGTSINEDVIENNVYEEILASAKGGIINANDYNGAGLGDFYPAGTDTLGYNSTLSSNLLMLTSNYPTYFGYSSSSASLSTESFYRLSVWAKTIGDTKASITLKNSSNYLAVTNSDANDGEYVGYANINTADKWVRYDFYIATNLSTGSVTLELFLGNKYAKNTTTIAGGETKVSCGAGTGTVYFDDVMLVKLADEGAYNKLVYGDENANDLTADQIKEKLATYGVDVNADGVEFTLKALRTARKNANLTLLGEKDATESYLSNGFEFELINYNTDSFDNYDAKKEDPKNNLESLLGNESNSFTHYEPDAVFNGSGANESDLKDNDHPNHLYGVYNKTNTSDLDEVISHIASKDYNAPSYAIADKYTEAQIREFLTTTYTDGREEGNNNYLMMANITKPSAQYYQTSSLSMAATSYYKITFYAKYLAVDANKKPEFRFLYNKTDDLWQTIQISASEEMVEYTFFYANESSKSVSAYLSFYLGSDDAQGDAEDVKNLMAGIVVVDDLSIVKITADEYTAEKTAVENDTNKAGTFGSYLTEAEVKEDETPVEDEEEEDEEEEENNINPQVWLIISSVVIGLILVAVIVVMIYRKLKTKVVKKLRKTKVDSAMPADFEKKQAQEKVKKSADSRKKDIANTEYDD